MEHSESLLPSCTILTCLFNSPASVNFLPQMEQSKSLCPLCTDFIWVFRILEFENFLPQTEQSNSIWSLHTLVECICSSLERKNLVSPVEHCKSPWALGIVPLCNFVLPESEIFILQHSQFLLALVQGCDILLKISWLWESPATNGALKVSVAVVYCPQECP